MLRTEEKMKARMKSATYVDYDNLDENEEEEEEPNKEEIDAKRKIFEKEAKKEIQQEFVDKIGFHIDYIKQGLRQMEILPANFLRFLEDYIGKNFKKSK